MNHELRKHRDELASELAELIQPELRHHHRGGVYIVLVSETGVECCTDFYGMTAPTMATWFRSEIQNWLGNGPAMLINDGEILKLCEGDFESASGVLTAIICHELTHCLQVPRLCHDAISADWKPQAFGRLLTEPDPVTPAQEARTRSQHPKEFIRLALHVRHRMQQSGWLVPLSYLLDWERFAYVAAQWHVDALAEDFERCKELPLSLVPKIPEPHGFAKLFDENLSTFEGFMSLVRSF